MAIGWVGAAQIGFLSESAEGARFRAVGIRRNMIAPFGTLVKPVPNRWGIARNLLRALRNCYNRPLILRGSSTERLNGIAVFITTDIG
jgi:hypothetical protein